MNQKEKIKEILVEGFATQPFRDWRLEARLSKKELEEARNKNLEHIEEVANQILGAIKQNDNDEMKDTLQYIKDAVYEIRSEVKK